MDEVKTTSSTKTACTSITYVSGIIPNENPPEASSNSKISAAAAPAASSSSTSSPTSKATTKMKNVVNNSVKKIKSSVKEVVFGPDDSNWEALMAIEQRRRAILRRTELPFFRILLFWDGTCLRILVRDPLMWFTMLLFMGVRLQARFGGVPDFVQDLSSADIGIIGGFLSFFLVFFVVQSNQRLDNQYKLSMGCKGRIFDTALLSKSSLPRQHGIRLIRFMNAAHVAGYAGLSDTYTFRNFFLPLNATNKFLTDEEVNRMKEINMDLGGSCYRELISWAMNEVTTALQEDLIDSRLACMYRDNILKLQACLGGLFNYADQPISFFYVHFLCLLSTLYLPLFAMSSGYQAGTGDDTYWMRDVLAGLIVLLQVIFVIGLRLLGQKMADPFGSDLEDLSVIHYINFTWRMSNRILAARLPSPLSEATENANLKDRASIGEAWGDEPVPDPEDELEREVPTDEVQATSSYCVIS